MYIVYYVCAINKCNDLAYLASFVCTYLLQECCMNIMILILTIFIYFSEIISKYHLYIIYYIVYFIFNKISIDKQHLNTITCLNKICLYTLLVYINILLFVHQGRIQV